MSNLALVSTVGGEVESNTTAIPVAPKFIGLPSSNDFQEGDKMEWNDSIYQIVGGSWMRTTTIPSASERAAQGWKEDPSGLGYIMPGGAVVPYKPFEEMSKAEIVAFSVTAGNLDPALSSDLNPPKKVPIFNGNGEIIGFKENAAGPNQTGREAISIIQRAAEQPFTQRIAPPETPATVVRAVENAAQATVAKPTAPASATLGAPGTFAPALSTPATTAGALSLFQNKMMLAAAVVVLVLVMRR